MPTSVVTRHHGSVKLLLVAGARPNFMKIAPLLRTLSADREFICRLVHTGQHYDRSMSGAFFEDLGLPEPDHHLNVGPGTQIFQTAEIMRRFEGVLELEDPDGVVVAGDVTSTVACAFAAKKLGCDVVHVEAGLRSFDRSMPEELNRIVTDALSDLLLVTEESGRENLLREGVSGERIYLVGNLMIDSLLQHLPAARERRVAARIGATQPFGIVTLHRPSNVDDPTVLRGILNALETIAEELPLYFPVHPRTSQVLSHLASPRGIHVLPPLGYADFLSLLTDSSLVLTDSGGLQEETTALHIPCITIRPNTERPVTITHGSNMLAGTDTQDILSAWETVRDGGKRGCVPPQWDGEAALRCRAVLREYFGLSHVEEEHG